MQSKGKKLRSKRHKKREKYCKIYIICMNQKANNCLCNYFKYMESSRCITDKMIWGS